MKRKYIDTNNSSPTKRLAIPSNGVCSSECDLKPDNLLQHKLYYCGTKSSSLCQINENISNSFPSTFPFDRLIQSRHFVYVPIPVFPSQTENNDQSLSPDNNYKPLDLSKPKKQDNEYEQSKQKFLNSSTSPLDLTIEKPANLFNIINSSSSMYLAQQQIYECDYCSIRFSSLKTLHAHQDNYCIEYRKQKRNANNNLSINISTNEVKTIVNDSNR